MAFFAEAPEELTKGVIGLDITLRSEELQTSNELRELASQFKSRCGDVEEAFDLGFLSNAEPPLGVYCACHGHFVDNKLDHFLLTLRRKPKSPTPPELLKVSQQLGGFPDGLSRLFSALGSQEVEWRASLELAVIESKQWPLKFAKRRRTGNIDGFVVEQENVRLKNAAENVDVAIMFPPSGSTYALEIKSRIKTKVEFACFETASDQLWNKIKPLFREK